MEKPESAISSLVKLRSYYQSQYEHYLALATASKENRERVSLLLQDLAGSEIGSEAEWESDYSEDSRENFPQVLESSEIVLDSSGSPTVKEGIEAPIDVDSTDDTMREIEAVKTFNRALEIIGSVSSKETGKTLHLNYFQKLLELQMSRSIEGEIVKLYLDEAISRGYLEGDRFDPNCYKSKRKEGLESFLSQVLEPSANSEVAEEALPKNFPTSLPYAYNLPPSSKLRATLLETIQEYMVEETPRRFSIRNVINYLYSTAEQQSWSRETKNKVGSCLSNVLPLKSLSQ